MKTRIVLLLAIGLVMVSAHSHEKFKDDSSSSESSESRDSSEEERPAHRPDEKPSWPALLHGEPINPEEKPLVRCKRPLCEMFCHNGQQMDANGCPLCECLEDPCEKEGACPNGQICKYVKKCDSLPCKSMAKECIDECPMFKCVPCEHGYLEDDNGCQTCQCKETLCHDHECTIHHKCVELPGFDCPFRRDDPRCKKHAICMPDVHFFTHDGEGSDEKDDDDDDDADWPVVGDIPRPPQDQIPSLCEFKKIFAEEFRKAVDQQLGRNHSSYRHVMKSDHARAPRCLPNGLFHPMQCNLFQGFCYCVDALGKKIEGTKTQVKSKEDMPECDLHHISSMSLTMEFIHEFEDVTPHLDDIKTTIHAHLAEWLQMEKEFIEITEIMPITGDEGNNNRISVSVTVSADNINDLSRARFMLAWHAKKDHGKLPFMGTFLTPDPERMKADHVSEPMTEDYPIREPEPDTTVSRCWDYVKDHKKGAIIGASGAAVFLIVVIAIIIVACKRKSMRNTQFAHQKMHEKSERYKENLAFSNEMYGQTDLTGEKKKPVEEIEKEEEEK